MVDQVETRKLSIILILYLAAQIKRKKEFTIPADSGF